MTLRKTVALKRQAEETLKVLYGRFPFEDQADVAKLAMAYAIRRGLSLDTSSDYPDGETGMTWNTKGTLDLDGSLEALLRALYPDEDDPYEVLQTLMNKGLHAIQAELDAGRVVSLDSLVNPPQDQQASA